MILEAARSTFTLLCWIIARVKQFNKCETFVFVQQGDNGQKGPEGAPGKDGARVSSKHTSGLLFCPYRDFCQPANKNEHDITFKPFKCISPYIFSSQGLSGPIGPPGPAGPNGAKVRITGQNC